MIDNRLRDQKFTEKTYPSRFKRKILKPDDLSERLFKYNECNLIWYRVPKIFGLILTLTCWSYLFSLLHISCYNIAVACQTVWNYSYTIHTSDMGHRFSTTAFLRHISIYCLYIGSYACPSDFRLPLPLCSSLSCNPVIDVRSVRSFPRCTRICTSCAPVGSYMSPHQLLLYKCTNIVQCTPCKHIKMHQYKI